MLTPFAAAKRDLTVVAVCGRADCSETRDKPVLDALSRLFAPPLSALATAPPLAPYYELRGDPDWPARFGHFVPGSDAVQWGWPAPAVHVWVNGESVVRLELERVAATLEPFPAPRPARVVVNGRLVRDPAGYVPLFGALERAPRPRAAGPRWIPVTFVWTRANPWSEASSMFYDPDDRALYRDGGWYRLPPALSRKIMKPRLRRP